ncbi:hypothetical protein [Amycolatopsis sp. WGS_07]|uniref:hypothetical protein n=1 Tax=Amycolatopsis sp. WGS_07 TaxID=3076764 RepID=UPI0038734F05
MLVHNSGCLDYIALGLEAYVEKLASAVGARSLMGDKDWQGTVWVTAQLLKLQPGSVRVSFTLDGMEGSDIDVVTAVNRAILRNARQIGGATDLELVMLKDFGALKYVDFYIGGRLMPNSF